MCDMGSNTKKDPLCDYFVDLMGSANLTDVEPTTLCPTRRNGRIRAGRVAKRMDRFLIGESLLEKAVKYRSWVDSSRLSDHHPIFLKLEMSGSRSARPFKFNHGWLKSEGFKDLICEVWHANNSLQNLTPMDNFMAKLNRLK